MMIDFPDEFDCPVCGNIQEWVDCWDCGGKGGWDWEDLQHRDPLWYDEDSWETCDTCDSQGGWWICIDAENHPAETERQP